MSLSSTAQDAWVELAESLRRQIEKKLAGPMTVEEIKTIATAAGDALCLHYHALTFDKDVELDLARIVRDDD